MLLYSLVLFVIISIEKWNKAHKALLFTILSFYFESIIYTIRRFVFDFFSYM